MTDQLVQDPPELADELGPVDWIVVEFPGSEFKGDIAASLADLVDRGTVRVLDLLILRKDDDGTLEVFELGDFGDDELGGLRAYETGLAMLLSADDVAAVAEAVAPGSVAGLLVWENLWAAPFGSAGGDARRAAGGRGPGPGPGHAPPPRAGRRVPGGRGG